MHEMTALQFFLVVPESCFTVSNCSGITTDGEYWVYPTVTNRKRTKIYCHNLPTEPSHFISLPKTCVFTHHDRTNWIIWMRECQSSIIPPLKQAEFLKVKIQIEVYINGMGRKTQSCKSFGIANVVITMFCLFF